MILGFRLLGLFLAALFFLSIELDLPSILPNLCIKKSPYCFMIYPLLELLVIAVPRIESGLHAKMRSSQIMMQAAKPLKM
jgi:hypothetical protein